MTDVDTPNAAPTRGPAAITLVAVGALITFLATLLVWVDRQMLDTDTWVDVTDDLLADDEIRERLAVYLVDELYAAVDVGQAIGDVLPEDLAPLGPIVAGALRAPAVDTVETVLSSDLVRTAWREANRTAHELLVAVIEDDTGDVLSTAGGAVTIDLGELVRILGERVGLGDDVLELIPEGAGVIVLLESDDLEVVQDAARLTRGLSLVLLVLVIVLFVAAVWWSGDRRRTTRDVGVALTVVGVVILLGRIVGTGAAAGAISRTPDDEPALSVLDIGTTVIRQMAITEVLLGLLLIGFATLVGPSSPAGRTRSVISPVLRHGWLSAIVGGILVYLVFLWLKPGGPIQGGLLALGLVLLSIGGVIWVQREIESERTVSVPVGAADANGNGDAEQVAPEG